MPNILSRQNLQKNRKSKYRHGILHTRNSLGIQFRLMRISTTYTTYTISNFWTKLTHKGISIFFKKRKENHHWILHIRISLGSKIQFQQNFDFFGISFPKKGNFRSKKEKNEYHHWIIHIRISPNIKFQLKLTIFGFWTNIWTKRLFPI